MTGDLPFSTYDRYPSWGEQSGQPAYAGRVAWTRHVFGRDMTLGEGAYFVARPDGQVEIEIAGFDLARRAGEVS